MEIGAPRAFGPRQSLGVAVIGGIAIDNDGRGPVLLRGVDLHRTMAPGIASHHDFASDVDAGGFHLRIVGRQSIIHVHHRRLNFARGGIRDERRHQFRIRRVRVQRIRGFANIYLFFDGFNKFDADGSRRRKIHLKLVNLGLETGVFQSFANGLGNGHGCRRARHVRPLGDRSMELRNRFGGKLGGIFRLSVAFLNHGAA